jgi:hypothetical protein
VTCMLYTTRDPLTVTSANTISNMSEKTMTNTFAVLE